MTEILHGQFTDELSSRYLTYALSTIMARALPDVRDGLKPVHRRLLYAMQLLKLDPEKGYKKCARVVGDVIGKYHPHGDQAVYDALVRLAQDFASRYPMVDGQGNFGSVDGDGAAAMRYTEARLTEVAKWLLKDLGEGTVDFRATYDDSDEEPVVLPACFPNLLANGTSGIAVGLSTSIPPHNVGELCNGLVALLKNPELADSRLLTHIQGPDFPTGGVLIADQADLAEAYATGRGSFVTRALWETEDIGHGQYQIVITQLPYQVQKSKVVEKIADLMHAKKLPWLADVMDESAEDIRLVLTPKSRNVDADALMASLFKLTDLENRFSLNMHVITGQGVPALLSLKQALQAFLDHRREVLQRHSKWRLDKIAARLHILAAYQVVYLNLDEVIEIIKENDHPAPVLMERFKLDEIQANAILDMRLRRLRKLEEMEIKRESDELSAEQAELKALMADDSKQTDALIAEVKNIKKQFGDARRTQVAAPTEETVALPSIEQIEKEPLTVLLSENGWVRALKGHMAEDETSKFKEGDAEFARLLVQSTDVVSFFTSKGKVYQVPAHKLPPGRGFGEPVRMLVDLAAAEEVIAVRNVTAPSYLLASAQGYGFLVAADDLASQTKNGKQIMNVGKGDALCAVVPAVGDQVAVLAETGNILCFNIADLPVLSRGKGVRLMNLKGQPLGDVSVFSASIGFGLLSDSGKRKQVFNSDVWFGKRAQVGKQLPHGFKQGAQFFIPEGTAEAAAEQPEPASESRVEELVAQIAAEKPELSADERQKQLDLLLGEDS